MRKALHWFAQRSSTFIEVIHAPESAFARTLDGPSYLLPLCVLSMSFVLLSLVQAPFHVQWIQHQMQLAGASQSQVDAGAAMMEKSQRWAAIAVPVLLILRWFCFALVLWLVSQLFLARLGFSRVLSIVAYSYVPMLFRDAVVLFILWRQGTEALNNPTGLNAAIGLDLLLPHVSLPWSALAGSINVFELWFLLLLTVGISKVGAINWKRALAMTLSSWIFVVLVQFGFVALGLSVRASLGL
jgi:hypothetical protein